jgi:hypothetical protein
MTPSMARWGRRGMDALTGRGPRAVAPDTERIERPAGPLDRTHAAPAVGHETQNDPSGVRSDAAG